MPTNAAPFFNRNDASIPVFPNLIYVTFPSYEFKHIVKTESSEDKNHTKKIVKIFPDLFRYVLISRCDELFRFLLG